MLDVPGINSALKCLFRTRTFRLSVNRAVHVRTAHGARGPRGRPRSIVGTSSAPSVTPECAAVLPSSTPPARPGAPTRAAQRPVSARPSASNTSRGQPSPLSAADPLPLRTGPVTSRSGVSSRVGPDVTLRRGSRAGPGSADDVDRHQAGLTAYSAFVDDEEEPLSKRRRTTRAGGAVATDLRRFATLSTQVRSIYERMKDWTHASPLVARRKMCRRGQFNTLRLRALERLLLLLECGGAGLSLEWQERL